MIVIPLSGPSNTFPLQSITSSDGGTSGRSWHLGSLKMGGVTESLMLPEHFPSSQDTGVTGKNAKKVYYYWEQNNNSDN